MRRLNTSNKQNTVCQHALKTQTSVFACCSIIDTQPKTQKKEGIEDRCVQKKKRPLKGKGEKNKSEGNGWKKSIVKQSLNHRNIQLNTAH